jgi:glutaredoxin
MRSLLWGAVLFFTAIGAFFENHAAAEVIRYQDEQGAVHFVDSIEKVPEHLRGQASSSLKEISRAGGAKYEPQIGSSSTSNKEVRVFMTTWCGNCRALEEFLKKEGIRHRSYDIEKDMRARQEYQALGGRGVPLVKIGERIIRGFNKGEIRAALK